MITRHAIDRFQERVANVPDTEVIKALDCPAVRAAMAWARTCTVRLGTGHRCVVVNGVVVTITPPGDRYPRRVHKPSRKQRPV